MANVITFSIKTEAPYTEDEKINLLDEFVAFMRDNDDDVIEDSEAITVIDENDIVDPVEAVLNDAVLSATVVLLDSDGKVMKKLHAVND